MFSRANWWLRSKLGPFIGNRFYFYTRVSVYMVRTTQRYTPNMRTPKEGDIVLSWGRRAIGPPLDVLDYALVNFWDSDT